MDGRAKKCEHAALTLPSPSAYIAASFSGRRSGGAP
jgi:hypothetical protein